MSKGNVLIVEVDHLNGSMLKKNLERLGFSVGAWVKTAKDALNVVDEQNFDLILTDYYLTDDLTGVELNREIQKKVSVPTIFITSSQEVEVIDDIVRNGPYGYIQKPTPNILRAVIELALSKAEKDKQLQELNDSLDRKVQERTGELDQAVKQLIKEMTEKEKIYRKLQEALESEKEFGELKSKIVSNLSHEFKTPLSSIRSSAQLIKAIVERTQGDERSLKHAHKIEQAVDMLTDILMRILSVEKDDNIFYNPQPIEFDMGVFIDGLVQEFDLEGGDAITLDYDIQIDSGLIHADPNLLRLIFTNLVSNACKYSSAGDVVKVSFKVESEQGKLFFRVDDQGIGMSNDDLKQIFFRFYRGHNVGSIEGTGIGLSIVKRAVDSLKGKIDVDTTLNVGTTVSVELPIQ